MASKIIEYQNLPIEEQFKRFIYFKTKSHSFLNEDGIEINVYSSFDLIKEQMIKFDIDFVDQTIENIYLQIKMKIEHYRKINENNIHSNDISKIYLIQNNIVEIGFYLYDYDIDKMSDFLKVEFNHCKEFAKLLKEYKYNI
jgi:hypothetical protein